MWATLRVWWWIKWWGQLPVTEHPAYRASVRAAVCPVCYRHHHTSGSWTVDFLAHDPPGPAAWMWLPDGLYGHLWRQRGWPAPPERRMDR